MSTTQNLSERKWRLDGDAFVSVDGTLPTTKAITTELIRDESQNSMQDCSLEEYSTTHLQGKYPPAILDTMKQFERFIACNLFLADHGSSAQNPKCILDVGCGIAKQVPPYLHRVAQCRGVRYVGLDPLCHNTERDYLFINGMFEGLHKHLENRLDFVVFSTSLDHFPDLDNVADELRKVMVEDGIAIFWSGLHDPEIVAKQSIGQAYQNFSIFSIVNLARNMLFGPIRLLRLNRQMTRRRAALSKGQALDRLHYHYFERASLIEYLGKIGQIVDFQDVAFSNSVFCALKIRNETKLPPDSAI